MPFNFNEIKKAADLIDCYQFTIYNKQLSTPAEPTKLEKSNYTKLSKQKRIKVLSPKD